MTESEKQYIEKTGVPFEERMLATGMIDVEQYNAHKNKRSRQDRGYPVLMFCQRGNITL